VVFAVIGREDEQHRQHHEAREDHEHRGCSEVVVPDRLRGELRRQRLPDEVHTDSVQPQARDTASDDGEDVVSLHTTSLLD